MPPEYRITHVILKPDNEPLETAAFDYLDHLLFLDAEKTGRTFARSFSYRLSGAPMELWKVHYADLFERDEVLDQIALKTIMAFSDKPLVLRYYFGDGIVERVRVNVGNTDPQKDRDKSPLPVRQKFCSDSLELAREEIRPLNNIFHAWDGKNPGELKLWWDFMASLRNPKSKSLK